MGRVGKARCPECGRGPRNCCGVLRAAVVVIQSHWRRHLAERVAERAVHARRMILLSWYNVVMAILETLSIGRQLRRYNLDLMG